MIEHVMERACAVVGVQAKGPFRASRLQGRDAALRLGQARSAIRDGIARRDVVLRAGARETLRFEGNVQAVVAPGAAACSRKQLDELSEMREIGGSEGVYTVKVTAEGVDFAAREKSRRGKAEEACRGAWARSRAI